MKGSHILTIFGVWAGLCFPGNIVTFYFLQKTTDLGNTTFNALEINETIFEPLENQHQDENLTVLQSKIIQLQHHEIFFKNDNFQIKLLLAMKISRNILQCEFKPNSG